MRRPDRRRFLFTATTLLGLLSPTGFTSSPPATIVLRIQGEIRDSMIPEVRRAIARAQGDPLPAGFIVLLDSGGGDGLAAAQIGRLLRAAQAHVFVIGRCASACTYIFMGGVVREAPDGRLGVHRTRLTRLDERTGQRTNIDVERSDRAARRLREGTAQLRAYLREMGILDGLYVMMESTPAESMRWLSRGEARSVGLIGFDRAYLLQREAQWTRRRIFTRGDLERLTAKVLPRCLGEAKATSPDPFVQCYRSVISNP